MTQIVITTRFGEIEIPTKSIRRVEGDRHACITFHSPAHIGDGPFLYVMEPVEVIHERIESALLAEIFAEGGAL